MELHLTLSADLFLYVHVWIRLHMSQKLLSVIHTHAHIRTYMYSYVHAYTNANSKYNTYCMLFWFLSLKYNQMHAYMHTLTCIHTCMMQGARNYPAQMMSRSIYQFTPEILNFKNKVWSPLIHTNLYECMQYIQQKNGPSFCVWIVPTTTRKKYQLTTILFCIKTSAYTVTSNQHTHKVIHHFAILPILGRGDLFSLKKNCNF